MDINTTIDNLSNYHKYLACKHVAAHFLKKNRFLELDLPVLSPALISESYLDIFETEHYGFAHRQPLYLTPSPELFIKRLLVAGIGDCYYLGKAFRNAEENGVKHSGEFTMLELYKVGADYKDIMDIVLQMFLHIAQELYSSSSIIFNNKIVDFTKAEYITVAEAFNIYAGITEIYNEEEFIRQAAAKGYVTKSFSYVDLWSQVYGNEVEKNLGKNGCITFIYDYPVQFAALSSPNKGGKTAQRFEMYIDGIELGNCYSELCDAELQEKRLQKEEALRKESGKKLYKTDEGFIEALKKGMPKTSGIAIGFDRLAMIFCDAKSIQDLKLITIS
jgi:elongation factor P--(R)-beta-lysine ligase